MSWLSRLPGYKDIRDRLGALVVRRNVLFLGDGFSVADDVANERTAITLDFSTSGITTDDVIDASTMDAGTLTDALEELDSRTIGLEAEADMGDVLTSDGAGGYSWEPATGATPSPGDAFKLVRVNTGATATEFCTATMSEVELDLEARNLTTTGTVSCAGLDTSSGTAPTGAAIGIENAGAVRWGGFSSGSADLTLDSSDRLVYESVDGDQFQLAPSRDGAIAMYRNGKDGAVNTTDATPTEICRITLPPNYQGVIDFVALGHKDGAEATDNLYVHGQVGVITDGSTVTLTAASDEDPVPLGDATTDSWAVAASVSGLNVIVSVTGGAYNVSWSASISTRPMRAN